MGVMHADPQFLSSESREHGCPELCQLLKEREVAWLQVASALIQQKAVDEEQRNQIDSLSMKHHSAHLPMHVAYQTICMLEQGLGCIWTIRVLTSAHI